MDRRELYTLAGSIIRVTDPVREVVQLFSVEAAAGEFAMLRPCDSDAKELAKRCRHGQRLPLSAGIADGALLGVVTVDRYMNASRMLVVDNPPLEFVQRRSSFRVPVTLQIDIGIPTADGLDVVSGHTVDLSQGGCAAVFADHERLLAHGRLVAVLVADGVGIPTIVEVLGVHPDRRATVRLRFAEITPVDRGRLAKEMRRLEVMKVHVPTARPSAAE